MAEDTIPFEIIGYSGDAMNCIMEALDYLADEDFLTAKKKLEEVDYCLQKAHQLQTDLIFKECNGMHEKMTIIMVHAQDHLMNAMLAKQLAQKMMVLFEKYSKRGRTR